MEEFRKLTTQEKALRINLSKAIYGSFAEIGAGQEVEHWHLTEERRRLEGQHADDAGSGAH